MRRKVAPVLVVCMLGAAVERAEAGMIIAGKLFDGEASARSILDAMRQGQQFSPSLKAPLAAQELSIELLDPDGAASASKKSGRSWKTSTDADGAFSLDTGLERWPEKTLLVARVDRDGRQLFSPYLKAAAELQDVHVYPLTESAAKVSARVTVAYDVDKSGDTKTLRIRFGVQLKNLGGEMYVGRRARSPWREVWRIPLPQGAVVSAQSSPYKGLSGWRPSSDGSALILDTPIPGVCDFNLLQDSWDVTLLVPPRQTFVQSYSLSVPVDSQGFTAWCAHDEMSIESPQLKNRDSSVMPDPFTRENRHQDVVFLSEPLQAGSPVAVILSIDNVAIGQTVSLKALKWVGGFVLVVVLSVLLGLALGPKGPTAEAILESLSGEELLDRVADLDARFARGEIAEKDLKRLREPLVALAAEEVFSAQPREQAPGAAAPLPEGAREVLRRIDEIDKAGKMDAALAAERAHLLEALARALPREAPRA